MLAFFLLSALGFAQATPSALHISGRGADRSAQLDCATDPCAEVLPGAERFEKPEGKPYVEGFNAADERVGWVVLSTDVVDVMGYSSKPLHTLVGVDPTGVITGGRVVHHSEPILLVGIPESKLHEFVDAHVGLRADEKVVVGRAADEGTRRVDAVSGATVTVLAETRTIMDSARVLTEDVGVIKGASRVPGHFVDAEPFGSWRELVKSDALGHLVVSASELDLEAAEDGRQHVDLWFGVVDSRQVGVPLLGEGTWKWATSELGDDEHLYVVFNEGTASFKGSGFVRGGLFDRFRIEQGLRTITFRDMDYQSLPGPKLDDAPAFWEGGLFLVRTDQLDPGATHDFVYLASTYATERGAFERDFFSFREAYRVPRAIYALDGPDPDQLIWREAWRVGWWRAAIVAGFYLWVFGLFVGRGWMAGQMDRLRVLHTGTAAASFFILGLWLHAQPSITQIFTVAGSAKNGWDWGLYLSEPTLFVSWIGIAAVTVFWGRGVFCGWLCPYGSLSELLFKLGRKLKLPEYELPDNIHFKLRYVRYLVFGILLAAFLYNAEIGEMMAEVEPFKSTFFVAIWTRHWGLILWWSALLLVSMTTYRPFCRYVCPLGAALALPSSFRLSSPYRRDFCSQCKICTRGCEPRAIRPDGTIDPRECLNCWECESNWQNDQVCPPLVKGRRDAEKASRGRAA